MNEDHSARIARLERTVRRQSWLLSLAGLALGGGALMAATGRPDVVTAQAIRIVDRSGTPRILIGAPSPPDGRSRKDGQTASIVWLDRDGHDRLIVGQAPPPRIDGRTFPRVADGYGVVLHDAKGSERGGMAFLDNGRGVIALDRPGQDAVEMVVNDESGFAGITMNYPAPLGTYREAVRIGTKGDKAWLGMLDRAQGERARLAIDGGAPPMLQTRGAGAPPPAD